MPRYSDADFLEEIRRVADLPHVDGPPSEQTFDDKADVSAQIVRRRFGSWRAAIEAAGLGPYTQADKIPRDKLVAELRWLRDEVGQIPTADQMDEHGGYAYITYYERFGSWADALEEVFGEVPDREWEHVSDADLLAELQRLSSDDGSPPTTSDVTERGDHAVSTYVDRFGSWQAALEAADFEPSTSQGVTTAELLAELRRLHDEFDTKPTTTIVRDHGVYSVATYYNRFDSWGDALDAAFETVPENTADDRTAEDRRRAAQTHSDDDLLEEIRRVADVADADGAPSLQDFRNHSDIADTTVLRRFDSWNAAVAKAGFEPNDPLTAIDREDLIAELRRLRDALGEVPTGTQMNEHGEYSRSTYQKRFGSWDEAVEAAFTEPDA
ncbi:homing endonuclease associated repeat-containing protein [Halorubrum sp. AS12]|uniref:homing endonuclease associated repeat-containing protein n=1 Tax=Halorubrum sp. AS12 TaxID=3409687 RepID=UPI003DA7322A